MSAVPTELDERQVELRETVARWEQEKRRRNGRPDAFEEVVRLLAVAPWELTRPPRVVNDSLDLYLTHPHRGDKTLTFDRMADFTNQKNLSSRLAFELGRRGEAPKQRDIYSAAALIGELAVQLEADTNDALAIELALSYLDRTHEATIGTLDENGAVILDEHGEVAKFDEHGEILVPKGINDQEARWRAYLHIKLAEDIIDEELKSTYFAGVAVCVRQHAVTLLDATTGVRYVHAGWFFAHARDQGAKGGKGAVSTAMRRVGWERPGGGGRRDDSRRRDDTRMYFRKPGGGERQRHLCLWVVPADWNPEAVDTP